MLPFHMRAQVCKTPVKAIGSYVNLDCYRHLKGIPQSELDELLSSELESIQRYVAQQIEKMRSGYDGCLWRIADRLSMFGNQTPNSLSIAQKEHVLCFIETFEAESGMTVLNDSHQMADKGKFSGNIIMIQALQDPNTNLASQVASYLQTAEEERREEIIYEIAIERNLLNGLVQKITAQQKCQVLDWLIYKAGFGRAFNGELVTHIFKNDELAFWKKESYLRYPNFELIMSVRKGKEALLLSYHFQPLPESPTVDSNCDFPIEPFFDAALMFWDVLGGEYSNDIEFTWHCYPAQHHFTVLKV